MVWDGMVWYGMVWHGVAWCGARASVLVPILVGDVATKRRRQKLSDTVPYDIVFGILTTSSLNIGPGATYRDNKSNDNMHLMATKRRCR